MSDSVLIQSGGPLASCLNFRKVFMYWANSLSLAWFLSHIGSLAPSGILRILSLECILIWEHFEFLGYTTCQSTLFPLLNRYMDFDFLYLGRSYTKGISVYHSTYKEGQDDTVPLEVKSSFWRYRNSPLCPHSLLWWQWDDLWDTDNTYSPMGTSSWNPHTWSFPVQKFGSIVGWHWCDLQKSSL